VNVHSASPKVAALESAIPRVVPCPPPIWLPLVLLIAGSVAIRFYDLDLAVQQWFWSGDVGWRFDKGWFVDFLYRYGNYPVLLVAAGGLAVWVTSSFVCFLKPARFLGGFLVLALIIGPGLLINVTLKDHYGRPRPRQVTEFGGSQHFRPVGEPTFDSRGKSFPSGHASMGFFWFVPAIYYWSRSRSLAGALIGLALLHGGVMGFGRMAQGGHWLSDILWSAGIVYVSGWILYRISNARAFSDKDPYCGARVWQSHASESKGCQHR
jgi:lipid A 4'-phosphatase